MLFPQDSWQEKGPEHLPTKISSSTRYIIACHFAWLLK